MNRNYEGFNNQNRQRVQTISEFDSFIKVKDFYKSLENDPIEENYHILNEIQISEFLMILKKCNHL